MSIVLQGSTSGSVTLQEPAVAGTTVLDLPATSGTVVATGSSGVITQSMLQTLVTPLGVGQTWQNLSGSRSAGVTYTNSTGRPIVVSVRAETGTSDCSIVVDSVTAALALQTTATRNFLTVVVPNGSTYIMQPSFSGLWAELR